MLFCLCAVVFPVLVLFVFTNYCIFMLPLFVVKYSCIFPVTLTKGRSWTPLRKSAVELTALAQQFSQTDSIIEPISVQLIVLVAWESCGRVTHKGPIWFCSSGHNGPSSKAHLIRHIFKATMAKFRVIVRTWDSHPTPNFVKKYLRGYTLWDKFIQKITNFGDFEHIYSPDGRRTEQTIYT